MTRVKIVGAGSIGNHLSHACREQGYAVTLCDREPEALRRTKEEIYPERYGAWDDEIRLAEADAVKDEPFEVVIVGTPPDSHVRIALAQLASAPPRVLFIEKPLCPPDLAGCAELARAALETGAFVGVGFNHTLTRNTVVATQWLRDHAIGEIVTLRSMTREHWGGIFRAHPWLAGPQDSYLGFTARGGGAIGEHCHAINIWQHFAHALGQGRVREVSAMLDWVEEDGARYDRLAQLHVRTEAGLVGTIVQDVVATCFWEEAASKHASSSTAHRWKAPEWVRRRSASIPSTVGKDALRSGSSQQPTPSTKASIPSSPSRPANIGPSPPHSV